MDVPFIAPDNGAQKNRQTGHPDQNKPEVRIPFRLCIFLGLGAPRHMAGGRQNDEKLITPEHEPGKIAAPEPHRRGVQRTQPAKIRKALRPFEIQRRKGKLKRDECPDGKARNTPEYGRNGACAHHIVHVTGRHRAHGQRQSPPVS